VPADLARAGQQTSKPTSSVSYNIARQLSVAAPCSIAFIETPCWKIFDAPPLIGATISLFFFGYLTILMDYR
jgi:hypothetical protein